MGVGVRLVVGVAVGIAVGVVLGLSLFSMFAFILYFGLSGKGFAERNVM